MKIIFLDFDGVMLNRSSFAKCSGIYSKAAPSCVAALNKITDATGAKIVVSSTWRLGLSLIELREHLKEWGVTADVIDRTPFLSYAAVRGHEITMWITSFKRDDIDSFVILDDEKDMGALLSRLVRTKFNDGLTEADADKAIELLSGI